jgi:hypothetical protein
LVTAARGRAAGRRIDLEQARGIVVLGSEDEHATAK